MFSVRYILKTWLTHSVEKSCPPALRDVSLYCTESSPFSPPPLETDNSYYNSQQQIENTVTPHTYQTAVFHSTTTEMRGNKIYLFEEWFAEIVAKTRPCS